MPRIPKIGLAEKIELISGIVTLHRYCDEIELESNLVEDFYTKHGSKIKAGCI